MTLKQKITTVFMSAMLTGGLLSVACEKPHAQVPSVILDWTATGDDSNSGTAATYTVYWSPVVPDTTGYAAWLASGGNVTTTPAGIQAWVNTAKNVAGPAPLVAGSAMSFTVSDAFLAGQTYRFMLKVCDEAGNCARSNFASKVIPTVDSVAPAAVINLRVR